MQEKIIIDMLTQDGVSIKKQKITIIDNAEYEIGEPWRKAYINNLLGRKEIVAELDEKYVAAIFSVWGDTPTVTENTAQ